MTQLFEVSGLSLDGNISILYGITLPGNTVETNIAPQGSIYLKTDGVVYSKTSPGSGVDTWVAQGSGTGSTDNGFRELTNVAGNCIVDAIDVSTTSTFVWCVTAQSIANPTYKKVLVTTVLHDGNGAIQPTKITYNTHSKLSTGTVDGFSVVPELSVDKQYITLKVITSETVNIQAYRMIGQSGGSGGYSLSNAAVDSVLFEFIGPATPTVGTARWTPYCPMTAIRFYFTSDGDAAGAVVELVVNGTVVSTCGCPVGSVSTLEKPNKPCGFGDSVTVNIVNGGGATNIRAYVVMAINLAMLA